MALGPPATEPRREQHTDHRAHHKAKALFAINAQWGGPKMTQPFGQASRPRRPRWRGRRQLRGGRRHTKSKCGYSGKLHQLGRGLDGSWPPYRPHQRLAGRRTVRDGLDDQASIVQASPCCRGTVGHWRVEEPPRPGRHRGGFIALVVVAARRGLLGLFAQRCAAVCSRGIGRIAPWLKSCCLHRKCPSASAA